MAKLSYFVAACFVAAALFANPSEAQHVYVSKDGDDVNSCVQVSPCKTFQRAHAVAGGSYPIIVCVDNSDFKIVTITRSITIDCTAAGGMIQTGQTAVTINGAGIIVELRGLRLRGLAAGNIGVNFQSGSALYLDGLHISGFRGGATSAGVYFAPVASTVGELHLTDTTINDNGSGDTGGGVLIVPQSGAIANVSILRAKVQNNSFGIAALGLSSGGGMRVSIVDTISSGAVNSGIVASSAITPFNMTLSNVVAANNGTIGVISDGSGGKIRMGGSTVTGNQTFGVLTSLGGSLLTMRNNIVVANGNDGTPLTAFPGPGGAPLQ